MRDSIRKKACCRGDIKQWSQLLVETDHDVGVIKNEEFSTFQNVVYMGVYSGLDEKIYI